MRECVSDFVSLCPKKKLSEIKREQGTDKNTASQYVRERGERNNLHMATCATRHHRSNGVTRFKEDEDDDDDDDKVDK